MSLPNLSAPHFDVKLPSGKVIKMRSMVMSEYKILMIAKESPDNISTAIVQILTNCIMDNVDVNLLSLSDIEYLFIQLHVSSNAKQKFGVKKKCTKCEAINLIPIDTTKIVSSNKDFKPKVFIFGNVGVEIGNPSFKEFINITNSKLDKLEMAVSVIAACINSVTVDEKISLAGVDFSIDDAKQMVDGLGVEQILQISDFLNDIPRIELFTGYECKCGNKENIQLKGINDFFTHL